MELAKGHLSHRLRMPDVLGLHLVREESGKVSRRTTGALQKPVDSGLPASVLHLLNGMLLENVVS